MTAHRYWRINITAVTGDQTNINLAEIVMAGSPGGATLFGSGTAFASISQGGLTPDKACDGDVTTWWSTPDPGLGWWAYDFGSAVSVTEVRIEALDYASVLYAPTAFTLDWSDDAATWTTVHAFLAAPWIANTVQSFDSGTLQVSKLNTYLLLASTETETTTTLAKLNTYLVVQPQIVRVPKFNTYVALLSHQPAACKLLTYAVGTVLGPPLLSLAALAVTAYIPTPAKVILRYSDDRGASWSQPITQVLDVTGGYDIDVSFRRLGMSRDRCWELSFSAPVATTLTGAFVVADTAAS